MTQKIRVAVIFGGRSGEYEVSLNSASSVISALDNAKYEVIPVGITREGAWLAGIDPHQAAASGAMAGGRPVAILGDPAQPGLVSLAEDLSPKGIENIDVVIPVLHGTYGEDGTIQGLLELANIPYAGSGVTASALGMDKVLMKGIFAYHGLPQTSFWSCLRSDLDRRSASVVAEIESRFDYPVFVKPANLGSSVGISKAHNRVELEEALHLASRYDRKLIIEGSVEQAREIEVSVLGNDNPIASVPGEIVPSKEFYDYEAKYIDGLTRLIIPAALPAGAAEEIRQLAIRAFRALDCAGMARVDFFVARDSGRIMVNEINTIPGFTKISMYPKLWEASGISYPELLDRVIELAMERCREKNRSQTMFDPAAP